MNTKIKNLLVVTVLSVVFVLVAPAYAVVIGDWEGSPDGWIDWGNMKSVDDPCNMPSKYEYATTGATLNSGSLRLKQAGLDQNLAIQLTPEQRVEFMANVLFTIDVTVPADSLGYGGWAEIYNVSLNAEGYGWNDQFASPPLFFGFYSGSPEQTQTLVLDYSTAKESMPAEPGFVEFIIQTNSDPNRGDFYFDNAQILPRSAVVICDWEGEPSDCNDWGNKLSIDDPCNMPSKYEYASVGATRGTQSLHLKQTGMDQNLAILLSYDQRVEFMANNQFMIDVTVPADSLGYGGWCEINNVVLNAEGYGWNDQFASPPLFFGFWNGSPERTGTLMIDYSAAKESMPQIPGFVEIVFTTNSDPNRGDFYFDNAQILFGPSELYNDTVMADSPVLYLKFDELTPIDSSGNNYWVGSGGTVILSGDSIGGGSIYLNGANVGAANQTTAPQLDPKVFGDQYAFAPDDITFEFWVKIEATVDGTTFFHQVGGWEDEINAPGFGHWQGDLRIFTGHRTGAYNKWHPGVATPSYDQWHHFVVTYDEAYGDPNAMQIQLYLDGNFSGSTILGDISAPAMLGPELNHLVIGSSNNALGGVYNEVTGKIDEFAVYAGVLGSDRVASHYASGVYDRDHATKTCADIWEKGLGLAGDTDKDCDVDMDDLTLLINGWLNCNDPNITDPDWSPDCVISW